jgi:ketosteroid isomerase-like protein
MTASDFVAAFADAWARSDPDRLAALLADDVRLEQPLLAPLVGREQARESFRQLFAALPDLRAEVDRWSATGDLLFIEFTFSATVGGRPLRWTAVDRFLLSDGLAVERASYFDPSPLTQALSSGGS